MLSYPWTGNLVPGATEKFFEYGFYRRSYF